MERQFVRIAMPAHPMQDMIGEIVAATEEGDLVQVLALDSSFNAWFRPADLQTIERGTKVMIEVEIRDVFNESMMIAGGWMPLTRIKSIVE